MKVNFDAVITGLDGKPVQQDNKELTLGSLVCTALLAPYPDEQNTSGEEKVKRYVIAQKAYDGGEHDLTAEDVTMIKKLLAKGYTPLPVAKAFALLDPASVPPKLKVVE